MNPKPSKAMTANRKSEENPTYTAFIQQALWAEFTDAQADFMWQWFGEKVLKQELPRKGGGLFK